MAAVPLPLPISSTTFAGSASPMMGISDARNCWKGLVTKKPSAVNQRVKGAESSMRCHSSAGAVAGLREVV